MAALPRGQEVKLEVEELEILGRMERFKNKSIGGTAQAELERQG